MNAIRLDAKLNDDERRQRLYNGDLFVYSPRETTLALRQLALELCEEAFAPYDPEQAQFHMKVDEYVEILKVLKPKFIHHPKAKQLIPNLLEDLGCDLGKTYYDVPRLRTSTSDNYLTSGLAYAFDPHRDTWYSSPNSLLVWWMPISELDENNSMAFHPNYWNRELENSSSEYNYQLWQETGRKNAAQHVGTDTRVWSQATEEVNRQHEFTLLPPAGGLVVFSGAQLHSSIPNTSGKTRLSVDFRTVNYDEIIDNSGAPNIDSKSTGTTIMDYVRCTDHSHFPEEVVNQYQQCQESSA